jgi:hypothetical protein
MCQKNVRTKTIRGRHLLTFESQKLNYFGKKGGPAFTYFDGALPRLFTEMKVLKNIFKRGYEEIRDRKLLEILKKDRTWLKYELLCNLLHNTLACGFFFTLLPVIKLIKDHWHGLRHISVIINET